MTQEWLEKSQGMPKNGQRMARELKTEYKKVENLGEKRGDKTEQENIADSSGLNTKFML